MADEEIQAPPGVTAMVEATPNPPAAQETGLRTKATTGAKVRTSLPRSVKASSRGHSGQDKLKKIGQIETQLAAGATLKDAVKSVGISDQTYYQWKKAAAQPNAETAPVPTSIDDEFAEFIQLEDENRRLRKQLSDKLRAENAELRKRLGLN